MGDILGTQIRKTPNLYPKMTPDELNILMAEMRFDLKSLSDDLQIPYRTLQNYSYGLRKIPEKIALRVRKAHADDRDFMNKMDDRIDEYEKSLTVRN